MDRITRFSPRAQNRAINDLLERVEKLEGQVGTLQVGDLSGATDGQQLTFEDTNDTWVPGDANPA